MPITTQSADGITHEFPDDTKPEVVDRAMKDYAEKQKDKTTTLGEIGRGVMDPIEGGGQLLSNVIPLRAQRYLDEFNNKLADYAGGLIRKLPEGGKNEQMRQREQEIQAERGANTGMDWARMAGNILSPVNYIGAGAVTGASRAANIARPFVAGAVAGAEQPATGRDFFTEKAMQTGVGSALGAATAGVMSGAAKGVEAIGAYLARKYPENITSDAVQAILRRMTQDQKAGSPSATDALKLVEAAKKPISLTDVTGENTRALAGRVARQPGEARNTAQAFLQGRDEQAAARLSDDIGRYVSGGPTMHQAAEALLQARSAASKPAYEAARSLQGVWSPRLEQFLEDPVIKSGLQRGYELERLQALAEGRPITTTQLGVNLDTEGNIRMLDKPNMRLLDMAKQGLDAMIADERNEITGRLSARGVALNAVRKAYIDEMDALDPKGVYKAARQAWAGYSASLDALRMGRSVFKMPPEETAAEIERMSPANREFYRMGVADMLRERLAKAGLSADEAKQLIKNPWMRDQLKPAFKSPDDFNAFVDAVTQESKMFGTRQKVLGGSPTAERLAEDASPESGWDRAAHLAERAVRGHMFTAAKTAYQMWRDLGLRPNSELNSKIAEILFTSDVPKDIADMLRKGAVPPKVNPAATAGNVMRGMGQGMAPVTAVDVTKERPSQVPPQ